MSSPLSILSTSPPTPGRNEVRLEYVPDSVPDKITSSMLEGMDRDRSSSDRLIIAIDFGTTYSAISYVPVPRGTDPNSIRSSQILSIDGYPECSNFIRHDITVTSVPTELMYPPDQNGYEEDTEVLNDDILGDFYSDPIVQTPCSYFDADADLRPNEEMIDAMTYDSEKKCRWGYKIHDLWTLPATHSDSSNIPLARFKLLLDDSETTKKVRENLAPTLKRLRRRKIIKDSTEIITDYLGCLLQFAKGQLRDNGFDDRYQTEIVLCVPAIWTQRACRIMQTCLAKAMAYAGFPGVDMASNCIENLFIVSEPEAAAAFMLAAEPELTSGDLFVLLDAGGGTVDANTYKISSDVPLRLDHEVVRPGGGLHGSSYLNEDFKELLHRLLDSETYLEQGAETISGIIEKITIDEFEYKIKRTFDYYAPTNRKISIIGLRDNNAKNFKRGYLTISGTLLKKMFHKRMKGIANVMDEQIMSAANLGWGIEKVVLIGGFAASISLRKYLENHLRNLEMQGKSFATLMCPAETTKAVAAGAVLRALNKSKGPRREARSSYGVLRSEPFGLYPEHKGMKPCYDRHDGYPYIKNTILWILKKGLEVPSVWQSEPFVCAHTFDIQAKRLLCGEILYVSDHATNSHYRRTHEHNKGLAEKIGEIEVDFTFLRDQGIISPINPDVDMYGKPKGSKHYKVVYTMVMRVVDRDLECFAIYNQKVMKKCRINIAPGFRPGVK